MPPKSLNFTSSHIWMFKTRRSKCPVVYGQIDRCVLTKESSTWERSQPSATRNLREEKCYSRRQLWITTCPRTSSGPPPGQVPCCLEKWQWLYFHTQLLLYDLVGKASWRFLQLPNTDLFRTLWKGDQAACSGWWRKGDVAGVLSRHAFWNKLYEVWYETQSHYPRRGCVILSASCLGSLIWLFLSGIALGKQPLLF